jgi:hypothetical protein
MRSVQTKPETLCLALRKADPIQYYSPSDKRLVREQFSREGKDGQKMARAIAKTVGCDDAMEDRPISR